MVGQNKRVVPFCFLPITITYNAHEPSRRSWKLPGEGGRQHKTAMLSATDALFTLHSSADAAGTPALDTGNRNGNKPSAVTGVCFVRDAESHDGDGINNELEICGRINEDDSASESSDDDCEPLQFRCSDLLLASQRHGHRKTRGIHSKESGNDVEKMKSYQHAAHLSAASHNSLSGAVLASCHLDGCCKIWDLATRRCIVNDICLDYPRGGPGLALRRLGIGEGDSSNQFLYQTRDPLGTVSLHDLHRPCTPLLCIHTHSTTFCAMSPCHIGTEPLEGAVVGGERNLVALPTEEQSVAVVRDLRCDPTNNPSWRVALGDDYISTMYGSRNKYGMLTSLALCLQETTQRIVMGCGMENGSSLFYDLGTMGQDRGPWSIKPHDAEESNLMPAMNEEISENDARYMCSVSIGKDPVLCLDLASSSRCLDGKADKFENLENDGAASLIAVGGCAGDADELSKLPEQDQGTIATIKVKLAGDSFVDSQSSAMKATIRAKTRTCSIASGGKVGVSICRFRPDGRIFAVGGWDHRLRLFSRPFSKPIAILRGHEKSVSAVDWAGNAAVSGLLATGADDGKINIWRAFPLSSRNS